MPNRDTIRKQGPALTRRKVRKALMEHGRFAEPEQRLSKSPATYPQFKMSTIDPSVIKALMEDPDVPGVVLENLYVTGSIKLIDFRCQDGRNPKPLELRGCFIDGDISIRSAHLARLSLIGSAFRSLDARDAVIESSADVSYVKSNRQIVTDEELKKLQTTLDGGAPSETNPLLPIDKKKLTNKNFESAILLDDKHREVGGFNFAARLADSCFQPAYPASAAIQTTDPDEEFEEPVAPLGWWGNTVAADLEVLKHRPVANHLGAQRDPNLDALERIDPNLAELAHAVGPLQPYGLCFITFAGARIDGSLYLVGSRFVGPACAKLPGDRVADNASDRAKRFLPPAINLTLATIGGDVYFEQDRRRRHPRPNGGKTTLIDEENRRALTTACLGQVKLRNTKIGGNFSADGLVVWGVDRPTINGSGSTIKGQLSLSVSERGKRFVSRGRILFKDASIEHGVLLAGGVYTARFASLDWSEPDGVDRNEGINPVGFLHPRRSAALDFTLVQIGRYFSLVRDRSSGEPPVLAGDLFMDGAVIGSEMVLADVRPELLTSARESAVSVSALNLSIRKDLVLACRLEGFCRFDGSTVGGSVRLARRGVNLSFAYTGKTRSMLEKLKSDGPSLDLERDNLQFGLSLRRVSIGSVLYVRSLTPWDDWSNEPWDCKTYGQSRKTGGVGDSNEYDKLIAPLSAFVWLLRALSASTWSVLKAVLRGGRDFCFGSQLRLSVSPLEARSRRGLRKAMRDGEAQKYRHLKPVSWELPWYQIPAYVHDIAIATDEEWKANDGRHPQDRYLRVIHVPASSPWRPGRFFSVWLADSYVLLDGDGADIDALNRHLGLNLGLKPLLWGQKFSVDLIRRYIAFYLSCTWDKGGPYQLLEFDAPCATGAPMTDADRYLRPSSLLNDYNAFENLKPWLGCQFRAFGADGKTYFIATCKISHRDVVYEVDIGVREDGEIAILSEEKELDRTAPYQNKIEPPYSFLWPHFTAGVGFPKLPYVDGLETAVNPPTVRYEDLAANRPLVSGVRQVLIQLALASTGMRRRFLRPQSFEGQAERNPVIDLRGASVQALDDQFGNGWRDYSSRKGDPEFEVRLRLDGFTYRHVVGTTAHAQRQEDDEF